MRIAGNRIHARNGRHGIHIESTGGNPGISGTATAADDDSVTHTGAGWTADALSGQTIEMGGALAIIIDNTTEVLTLSAAGWTDRLGNSVEAPDAGAYQIYPTGGIVDVFDNKIDCTARDGGTLGGNGIRIKNGRAGMRVRVDRNEINGANTDAIYVQPSGTYDFALLQLTNNYAWDDQPTPTCTSAIRFSATTHLGRLVLGGNGKSTEVTNFVSGLSSGVWLVRDGDTQEWAGWGAPSFTAPKGSTYRRKDGSGTTDCFYVNTSGSTTWTAK